MEIQKSKEDIQEVIAVLRELQAKEMRLYNCAEISAAMRDKFIHLQRFTVPELSKRLGNALSTAYRNSENGIQRERNDCVNRIGGSYKYGVKPI